VQYLLAAVTIVRHFSELGIKGAKAKNILSDNDNQFIISIVSFMEILYLSEKKRIKIYLNETLNTIEYFLYVRDYRFDN